MRTLLTTATQSLPVGEKNTAAANTWYEQVAREYGAALARLARAYEVNAVQQQDLLQEIHLALWRSFGTFKNQCSLRTWVYRIAHNVASTHALRHKRSKQSKLLNIEEVEELPAESDTERLSDESAVLDKLSVLVRQLKPIDRDVILLYLEGIDASGISDVTGISPVNVAQKIHRIKKVLQRNF